jgi:hypothetical protein
MVMMVENQGIAQPPTSVVDSLHPQTSTALYVQALTHLEYVANKRDIRHVCYTSKVANTSVVPVSCNVIREVRLRAAEMQL